MNIREGSVARILVADDEAAIRESYALVLGGTSQSASDEHSALEAELFGTQDETLPDFEVCLCRGGEEAVEAVQKAVEAGTPYAVAFLDVRMPPGIDGVKAAERIRAIDSDISIVMVTGYSDLSVEKIAERVKPADKLLYCQKPLHASEIRQLARAMSEKWRLERELHLLKDAVEQNTASVVIMDADGTIEYVNPKFSDVSGYSRDEAVGKNMCLMKSERNPESVYQEIWDTLGEGRVWHGEMCNETRDGQPYWEYARVSPVKSRDGTTRHFLCVKEDITYRKEIEAKLEYQANYDAVTGLPNRALALDRLREAIKRAKRAGNRVGVLFIDLDDFNKVMTPLGPSGTDEMLREVGERLTKSIRQTDTLLHARNETVAHFGSGVFVAIFPDLVSAEEAEIVSDRLRAAIEEPFSLKGQELFMTASTGITLYPDDGENADTLLRNGSAAAQRAKEAGGNTGTYFTPEFNERARQRLAVEACLRRALRDNDLQVMFQPIVSSDSDRIVAAEALVRCGDGQGGLMPPDKFISIAEHTGLIDTLGEQVLQVACRQVRAWRSDNDKSMRVAVNVSPRQFYSGNLAETIRRCIEDHQLPSDALEIEITESLLLDDTPEVANTLRAICDLGVPLSIDDFGTGYSSLSALRRFPLDTLKIDRTFVKHLPSSRADAVLVDTIVSMAHNLGLRTVAEGVETQEQFDYLSDHKCDYLQGFLFSKPIGSKEFSELLSNQGGVKLVLT